MHAWGGGGWGRVATGLWAKSAMLSSIKVIMIKISLFIVITTKTEEYQVKRKASRFVACPLLLWKGSREDLKSSFNTIGALIIRIGVPLSY